MVELKDKIAKLPGFPGVYKYMDAQGNIIYIGKAKNLKKRVSSYFTKKHENRKTAVLVSQIVDLEFTVVDTEFDALLLENSLIKEFQPKFNINLKDDKSYPLIKITKERFPKVFSMRNPVNDGSEYFGPYASIKIMHTVLDLIKQLYPIRNCNLNLSEKNIEAGKFKVCLEYQIGNCLGPCEGYQDEESYMDSIRHIRHLLKGNLSEVSKHLKLLMKNASQNMEFEQAHKYKEKLDYLRRYQVKSTIVSHTIGNVDVFNFTREGKYTFVNFLRVNGGIVVQTQNLEIRTKLDETDEEVLLAAIGEVHSKYRAPNKVLILPLSVLEGSEKFKIIIPKLGDKKKLIDLSLKNAMFFRKEKMAQYEKLNPDVKAERLMRLMQKDLRLKELPIHAECFDNSNLQGTNAVSACVVFKNGKPSKKDYRIFNVKTVEGPDDFATMKEALTRRYSRLIREKEPLPQLIVIDGGKGQLSSSVEALKEVGAYGKIAIIGIAKRLEEIFYPDDPVPLYIDKRSETLKVIQHMRDEAHRFGITAHRSKRDKSNFVTSLDSIKGIGPESIELLLTKFKSVKKVKEQSFASLAMVIGESRAKKVIRHFEER